MGLFFKIHFISDFESFYSAKLFSFPNFIISFHQLIIFFSYCFFKMGFFGEVVFCKKDHFQLNLMEICLGPAIFFFKGITDSTRSAGLCGQICQGLIKSIGESISVANITRIRFTAAGTSTSMSELSNKSLSHSLLFSIRRPDGDWCVCRFESKPWYSVVQ